MKQTVKDLIIDISLKYGFFPVDIGSCYEKDAEYIDNITHIFNLTSRKDEEVLETACEILCENFENFAGLFTFEKESTREQKLLVITAFLKNIHFFSMCWNYMIVEKHKASVQFVYSFEDDYEEFLAAGTEGMKKFGKEHEIPGFGVLGQMCDTEDSEYQFYIQLTEEVAIKAFIVEIEFKNTDRKYSAKIISSGDGTRLLHSDSIQVGNIFNGIEKFAVKIIPAK